MNLRIFEEMYTLIQYTRKISGDLKSENDCIQNEARNYLRLERALSINNEAFNSTVRLR